MTGSVLTKGFGGPYLITKGYGSGSPIIIIAGASLREAVFARLAGSPAIAALVGTRIYFGALPQTANLLTGPALVYYVVSRPYGHTLGGSDKTSSARVQMSAFATTEAVSDRITRTVRSLWDGFAGTVGGVQIMASVIQGEQDIPHAPKAGTDQWIYELAVDYLFLHRVT